MRQQAVVDDVVVCWRGICLPEWYPWPISILSHWLAASQGMSPDIFSDWHSWRLIGLQFLGNVIQALLDPALIRCGVWFPQVTPFPGHNGRKGNQLCTRRSQVFGTSDFEMRNGKERPFDFPKNGQGSDCLGKALQDGERVVGSIAAYFDDFVCVVVELRKAETNSESQKSHY